MMVKQRHVSPLRVSSVRQHYKHNLTPALRTHTCTHGDFWLLPAGRHKKTTIHQIGGRLRTGGRGRLGGWTCSRKSPTSPVPRAALTPETDGRFPFSRRPKCQQSPLSHEVNLLLRKQEPQQKPDRVWFHRTSTPP